MWSAYGRLTVTGGCNRPKKASHATALRVKLSQDLRAFRILEVQWPRAIELFPGYAVGSLGAYWTIQRTLILLGGP